ncbi:MAG TPA: hypothetical protein DIV44_03850 [Leeuwenhoekiella sp.]|nr:hypothetical protein [Leeuwenhoekiella sp.]|tara:strand:+ start:10897 stop:11988 length:1092 start_codon:yes stop_codon:yes gene_type:complete
MKISSDLSNKIYFLTSALVLLIVYIHSFNIDALSYYTHNDKSLQYIFVFFIEDLISNKLSRVAVPIYFFISGLLLFKDYHFNKESIFGKLISRLRTLLLPYLVWSLGIFILFFLIQYNQKLLSFFKNHYLHGLSFKGILNAVFYDSFNYQLWFVRDLFLLVLISPIIYIILKSRIWFLYIVILLIFWLLGKTSYMPNFDNQIEALSFFSFGALIAIRNYWDIVNKGIGSKFNQILVFIWIFVSVFLSYLSVNGYNSDFLYIIYKINLLLGVCVVWNSSNYLIIDKHSFLSIRFFSLSFFIFCFHEPVLTIFKKIIFKIFNNSPLIVITAYFLLPILVILLGVIIGNTLKIRFSGLYKLLTGNR